MICPACLNRGSPCPSHRHDPACGGCRQCNPASRHPEQVVPSERRYSLTRVYCGSCDALLAEVRSGEPWPPLPLHDCPGRGKPPTPEERAERALPEAGDPTEASAHVYREDVAREIREAEEEAVRAYRAHKPMCNSGHNFWPLSLWTCPDCANALAKENRALKDFIRLHARPSTPEDAEKLREMLK